MTPQIQRAVFHCGEASAFAAGTADYASPLRRYHLAVALTNYVQAHASAARYRWQHAQQGGAFVPPASAEEALERGIGACGNQHAIIKEILDIYQIPNRTVQVFWHSGVMQGQRNHIMCEMQLESGVWAVMDPLYGCVFKRSSGLSLLSYAEVRAGVAYTRLFNQCEAWAQRTAGDPPDAWPLPEHYTVEPYDYLLDYAGLIHPYVIDTSNGQIEYSLIDSMPVLGRLPVNGGFGNIEFELPAAEVPSNLHVYTTNAVVGSGALQINGGAAQAMPAVGWSSYVLPTGETLRLSVQGNAYQQLGRLIVKPA